MKTVFFNIIFLFSMVLMQAQSPEENRFQQSEDVATGTKPNNDINGGNQAGKDGPTNPPGEDEIPVDNYLPILAILGTSLIVYKYRYKISKF